MNEFAVKNLGQMKYFLGIKSPTSNGIILSQQKFILDLLAETQFAQSQPTKTPIEVNHRLTLNKDEQHPEIWDANLSGVSWDANLFSTDPPRNFICC